MTYEFNGHLSLPETRFRNQRSCQKSVARPLLHITLCYNLGWNGPFSNFFSFWAIERLFISKWGRISPESDWCWFKLGLGSSSLLLRGPLKKKFFWTLPKIWKLTKKNSKFLGRSYFLFGGAERPPKSKCVSPQDPLTWFLEILPHSALTDWPDWGRV